MANVVTAGAQKVTKNIVSPSSEQAYTDKSGDADLFLKRSAAYYHAQTPTSIDSVSAVRTQRDPMLVQTLQSLAPLDTNFSPTRMHSRLKAAQDSLVSAMRKINDKEMLVNARNLQQKIEAGLLLQQEATDNQRLLIRA